MFQWRLAPRLTFPLAVVAAVVGCARSGPDEGRIGTTALAAMDGTLASSSVVASGFRSPFDAIPSIDGNTIYFTAISADGQPGVYSVSATGGTVTTLAEGAPLVAPVGIALQNDGKRLFIADLAASSATAEGGQVFSLAATGGALTPMAGTEALQPRAVAADDDTVYFIGVDATGVQNVFSIPGAGGSLKVEGALPSGSEPVGIAWITNPTAGTDVYVLDSARGGSIVKMTAGVTSTFATGFNVGLPGGIAPSRDNASVLVSTTGPTGSDAIVRVDLATGARTSFSTGLTGFNEPAGLHRAWSADTFAFADSSSGRVFVLK